MAAVDIRVTDAEQFRSFAHGVAAALDQFGSLSDEEKGGLPLAAKDAICALTWACGNLTGQEPGAHLRVIRDYPAPVILEWPQRRKPTDSALPGWGVAITDAATGEMLVTVTKADVVIHADAQNLITADLTMLTDADGEPLRQEPADPVTGKMPSLEIHVGADGVATTGVFRAVVAEMRVRDQEGLRDGRG